MMRDCSNSSLDKPNAGGAVVKPHDLSELSRTDGQRAHFGIKLVRKPALPFNLWSPNHKKRQSVISLIDDAIQISTSPVRDVDVDSASCHQSDETASVSTIETTQKKVNFDLLRTEEFEPNPLHLLDDETIAAAWYSDDERLSMKFNRDNALGFGSDNQEWVDGMNALIHFCYQAIPQSTYDPEDLKEKARTILPKYRGLEVHGLPPLSAMRRKHMSSVLMHIARIPKKIPDDLRDRMVSARSLQYSRPFTLLALILAQADAEEA